MFMSPQQVKEFLKEEAHVFALFSTLRIDSKDTMGELPVVRDFLEMFPNDISDFLPEWEVEFFIDLVLDTSPVSIAPYKIFASELSEMKKKLEDLLEKKFVWLSVFSWGAPVLLVKKNDDSMRLCVHLAMTTLDYTIHSTTLSLCYNT